MQGNRIQQSQNTDNRKTLELEKLKENDKTGTVEGLRLKNGGSDIATREQVTQTSRRTFKTVFTLVQWAG